MRRRVFLGELIAMASLLVLPACSRAGNEDSPSSSHEQGGENMSTTDIEPLEKSKSEWREILDEDAFDVLFREKTERPFSSPLNDEHREGMFICAACFLPLFSSDTKFDSGTGWPSFYDHLPGRIGTKRDFKMIIPRTEYHCIRCKGHQGHVFNDGPQPTGQRWCNNGVALRFVPEDEVLPELRS